MNIEIWIDSPQHPDIAPQKLELSENTYAVMGGRGPEGLLDDFGGSYVLLLETLTDPHSFFSEYQKRGAILRVGLVYWRDSPDILPSSAILLEDCDYSHGDVSGVTQDGNVKFKVFIEAYGAKTLYKWTGKKFTPVNKPPKI